MRRLGSTFITLWLAVFGPCVVIWGLWIRGSEAGANRFRQSWDWLADHLAYPLIFRPLTDWAWPALTNGTPAATVIGFILLVALWALVVTLPFMFIAFWWVVLARSMGHSAAAGVVAGSSLTAPSGALYLLTMPLALLWAGLRWIVVPDPTGERPVRRFFSPVVKAFLLSFVLVTGGLLIAVTVRDSHFEQARLLVWMQLDAWDGYLDALLVPALMEDSFKSAINELLGRLDDIDSTDRDTYLSPSRSEVRATIVLLAVRHAILAATVMLILRSIWWYSNRKVTS